MSEEKADYEAEKESFVIIKFNEPGSAMFTIAMNNVTPYQIHAAIKSLELRADSAIIAEENQRMQQEAANQIIVPGVEVQ